MSQFIDRVAILKCYHQVKDELQVYDQARLVAVSKRQPIEKIKILYDAGHRDFGENYLQEWLQKKKDLPEDIRWHFIGSVQSRKVRELIEEGIYCIHGFGSESSLKKLQQSQNKPDGGCFLQVNLAAEEQKGGVQEEEITSLNDHGLLKGIRGLMCIPPFGMSESDLSQIFSRLRAWAEKLDFKELSMGMSQDYKIALKEGATWVRLGTTLFGERLN